MTKNDTAWQEIENELNIIRHVNNNNEFIITTNQIKSIGEREPRLMAKFDHKDKLPKLFSKNELGILPVSRSEYFISKFRLFCDVNVNNDKDIDEIIVDKNSISKYKTININEINSEDKALLIAKIFNIFQSFTGENDLRITNKGRFGTDILNFSLETLSGNLKEIVVRGSMADLDLGIEGNNFYTVEAKMGKINDFNIRQLYYPFLYWSNRIDKPVIPIFFVYHDKSFHLYQYHFLDKTNFHSIKLIKHSKFSVSKKVILNESILDIDEFLLSDLEGVPFPQADDFEKVIDVIDLIYSNYNNKEDFTEYFDFTPRQTDYYFNAARYLGLVERHNRNFYLTELGLDTVRFERTTRHAKLIKLILLHKVFYDVFMIIFRDNTITNDEIIEIMENNNVSVSENTLSRRAQTIKSWCLWIKEKFEENA